MTGQRKHQNRSRNLGSHKLMYGLWLAILHIEITAGLAFALKTRADIIAHPTTSILRFKDHHLTLVVLLAPEARR
jgi:hypothetical protein